MMKGTKSSAKLANFAELVMFKIPKTQLRIGEFEDRSNEGVWLRFRMRSEKHLVATPVGVPQGQQYPTDGLRPALVGPDGESHHWITRRSRARSTEPENHCIA